VLRSRLSALLLSVLFGLLANLIFEISVSAQSRPITLESLLDEMTDRDDLARLPQPAYTDTLQDSHDPRKTDPANQSTWHTNNDAGNAIRTEKNEGRSEWVIMEHQGPGAIVRLWAPVFSDKNSQKVRFYFDGATTPAITANLNSLVSGLDFIHPPFAFVSWNQTDLRNEITTPPPLAGLSEGLGFGGDLYFPIPFSKSCKITLDQVPFYYQVTCRAYAPGTQVETFSMDAYKAAQAVIDRTATTLLDPPQTPGLQTVPVVTIAAGQERVFALPPGPAAVRTLQLQVSPQDGVQVLRSVIIEGNFDDEPTIWCPLGDFFGNGIRFNAMHDWYRTTTKDGHLTARWIMPYRKSAHFAVKNLGKNPVTLQLSATVSHWAWDDRSLYFHASWHSQFGIPARPYSDWNYIEIQGKGRYVGDTLDAYSPVGDWWGEGDERIYLDGERMASQIGTGTEDYYGYAWGLALFFDSPFISDFTDSTSRANSKGVCYTSRVRLLDDIPFQTSIKTDMEINTHANEALDFAAATFWYASPGATSNRVPQPEDAARAVTEPPKP
jgi:hypothetical protein